MDQTKLPRHLDPFDEAPDTQFYWSGAARSTPLAQVEAAIERGNLAIACAGATGSGRTAFLYRLAEHLGAAGARFIHPDRVVSCKTRGPADHLPRAWQGASARTADKETAVLLLDDVDQLSRAEMTQLRDWWTALREKREKVALVVSCAASAVDPDSGARRQDLRAMIDTVAMLQPLTPADIEEVIRYRLGVAGCEWENVFTQPALEKIAFYAKGTPKRLVQICARVVMLAEESDTFPAGPDLVKEAAHQLFLPSHLREFSKKISLGLAPVPGWLNESTSGFSPSLSPAADTVIARSSPPEPLTRLADDHADEWPQHHDAKPLDPVRRHEPMRHDEVAAAGHKAEDDSGQTSGGQAAKQGIAPVQAKRRRLRGSFGVVAVCVMAVVTGAIGYILGQVDMKPVEVVRLIPQLEPAAPEDGTDHGSLAANTDEAAPSPASETAPPPEPAPAPKAAPVAEAAPVSEPAPVSEAEPASEAPSTSEAAPVAEALPPPEPAPASKAAPVAETSSTSEAAPLPEAAPVAEAAPPPEPAPAPEAPPVPETSERMPAVAPPAVASVPEVAMGPAPSKALAEAEGDAPGALADAVETAGEGQDANVSKPPFDGTPPSLPPLSTSNGDDGAHDAGSDDAVTASGSGRTSIAAQDSVTQHAPSPAISDARGKQEAAGNNRRGAGFAERGETLASLPAVKEPAVRLQRDGTVMRAQALLAQLDLYGGAVDGLLGERTTAAIRAFQKSMSMAETGKVSAALLEALEKRASAPNSDFADRQHGQGSDDGAVEAAETLEIIDIMDECRGKEAEWVYIAAINRHVLCGGLSAGSPN